MTRILIVEDEVAIAELEKDYLEMNNYKVDVATEGKGGLQMALEEEFDLIILDLMIPGIDGQTICREVRKVKDIPIIIVSARKEEWDKVQMLGIGADDYMTKPFSPSELVARVKAHLSRYNRLVGNHRSESSDVEIRGLKIDKISRRVFLDGEEKTFTGKEYDLLLFLAENPNRVFGKEELFREIWKAEPTGTDIATVTVHIKKIREKVEKDSGHPMYIETLWGVGYRFKM